MDNNAIGEEWRDVQGYECLYQVSNLGRVKSLDRMVDNGKGKRFAKGTILAYKKAGSDGQYDSVSLCRDGKIKYCTVHRLVANAFIPNNENLPEVNHKDENTHNNCVDNLEWCTRLYNTNYGTHNEKLSKTKSMAIIQENLDGMPIGLFSSAKSASKALGFAQSGITHACNGRLKTYKGYKWRYCCEQ